MAIYLRHNSPEQIEGYHNNTKIYLPPGKDYKVADRKMAEAIAVSFNSANARPQYCLEIIDSAEEDRPENSK